MVMIKAFRVKAPRRDGIALLAPVAPVYAFLTFARWSEFLSGKSNHPGSARQAAALGRPPLAADFAAGSRATLVIDDWSRFSSK
jgi:hypothetical protein